MQIADSISFYTGAGVDHRGRRLDEILAWDDERLEDVHDYIQWLFPLNEPSGVNPHAPLITDADCQAFSTRQDLARNLQRSFERMLDFYGFRLIPGKDAFVVVRSSDFDDCARVWLRPHNHNFLRLTRMMKSLRLLGRNDLAQAFYDALLDATASAHAHVVGSTTLRYWSDAAGR